MREQWDELKETIIELRDNNGTATQQEVCQFLANLMNVLEAQIEPKRKKGEWLDNETSYSDDVPQTCTCSVCRLRSRRPVGDFCKWCGADMRE